MASHRIARIATPLCNEASGRSWNAVGATLILLVISFTAAVPGANASPPIEQQAGTNRTSLSELVTRAVEEDPSKSRRVGLVIGVVADQESIVLGFGDSDADSASPPDANTVFEIGSITKVFTGILLAQAVERGTLKLSDPIADLLPDNWSVPDAAKGVTLQHLTTHASGFPRLPAGMLGPSGAAKVLIGGDPYRDYDQRSFRSAIANVKLIFEPGTDTSYSNFAVGVLGFVLSNCHDTDYGKLVKEQIFDPLEMRDSVVPRDNSPNPKMAVGYRSAIRVGTNRIAFRSANWILPPHLAGAGGIRSTGADMLTFLKANMATISTPLDSSIRQAQVAISDFGQRGSIGMNWIRTSDASLSQDIIWHNGGTGGFRSFLGFTQDRRTGVVVLSNTSHSVDELAIQILKLLAGGGVEAD